MFRVFKDVKAQRNKNNEKKKMGENRDQEFSLYYAFLQPEGENKSVQKKKKIIALVLRSLASGPSKMPRDTGQREDGRKPGGLCPSCALALFWALLTWP